MRKKTNSKSVVGNSFLRYFISKERMAPDLKRFDKTKMQKHQLTLNNSNRLLG